MLSLVFLRPKSIGMKMSLWLAFQTFVGLGLISVALYVFTSHDLYDRQSEAMANKRLLVQHAVQEAGAYKDRGPLAHKLTDIFLGHPDMALVLMDSRGQVVFNNTEVLNHQRGEQRSLSFTAKVKPTDEHGFSAHLHFDVHPDVRFLRRQGLALLAATVIGTLLASAGSYLLVRRGLAPVRELVRQTGEIAPDKLDRPLDGSTQPAELLPLVQQFNDLLSRLQKSYEHLDGFNADVAHELRTPLSTLIASTEIALGDPALPSASLDLLGSNLEDLQRMASIVNDMLFLSRASQGAQPRYGVASSLAPMIHDVLSYHEAPIADAALTAEVQGKAFGTIDAALIKRAVSNLVGNATRYADAGSVICIKLSEVAGTLEIAVSNKGIGIPPVHLPRLFDRFYRVDASRTNGTSHHGLGLSIVAAIAEMHGGAAFARSDGGETTLGLRIKAGPV